MSELRVLVTGAAGQIGYSIVLQIAKGDVFGRDRRLVLVLLDIPQMSEVLEGVKMELIDCALPLLADVVATTDEASAFKDIDAAFLVGAMPRKAGMERKDLLAANVKIFKSQGKALADGAKPNCKVIVVGNPANTNAAICAKYAAPKISPKNINAMTRLDHNRARAQVAMKCGVPISNVKNVVIWGNHSVTQFPDVAHAKILKGADWVDAKPTINDDEWLQTTFLTTVQKRGAEIIKMRKLSSAMSAAKAACDHVHDWFGGIDKSLGDFVSVALASDGSYGIPEGIVYSFPCTNENGEWKIVQGLNIDDYARGKMDATLKELQEELDEATKACE